MFGALRQNSYLYILDKNDGLKLKIGQVVSISSVQYTSINPTVDITVKVNNDTLEFKQVPSNLSIANYGNDNIIISESSESMSNEVETLVNVSKKAINEVSYHNSVIESGEDILAQLNPKIAKEKEQEAKISKLESKVDNIETYMLDIKEMMNKMINKN